MDRANARFTGALHDAVAIPYIATSARPLQFSRLMFAWDAREHTDRWLPQRGVEPTGPRPTGLARMSRCLMFERIASDSVLGEERL